MSYRIRFHPAVADDLDAITRWLIDYVGPQSAARRLDEIEATIVRLSDLPHKGSRRDKIAPGLRAIPAGRKAMVAFTVDDDAREVHTHAVNHLMTAGTRIDRRGWAIAALQRLMETTPGDDLMQRRLGQKLTEINAE